MRKIYFKLGLSGGVIAGLLGLASKIRAENYIDINATSVASVIDYVGKLFADVQVFIWLAIGLPLGFWVITKVVSLVAKRTR